MTVITGIELDTEKSSATDKDWSLYFTGGEYQGINVKRTVQPAILHLSKSDYRDCKGINPCLYYLYYNPKTNQYSQVKADDTLDVCNDYGYMIGGFQIKDCRLTFVYSKDSKDCTFKRTFTDAYDESYNHTPQYCQDCTDTDESIFDPSMFSTAYIIECPPTNENGNGNGNGNGKKGCSSFRRYSFNEGYETQDCPPSGTGIVDGSQCCTAFPDQ
jgi:hypothetical protein